MNHVPVEPLEAGTDAATTVERWHDVLADAPTSSAIRPDHARSAAPTGRRGRVPVELDATLTDGVRTIALAAGTTPSVILAALMAALLHRHTGQHDVLFGLRASQLGGTTGPVPVRSMIGPGTTFAELTQKIKIAGRRTARPGRPPTMSVAAADRDPYHDIVFENVLVVEEPPALPGIAAERLPAGFGRSSLDLCLMLIAYRAAYTGFLDYAVDLFEPVTAERIAGRFRTLVASVVGSPARPIEELSLLPPEEEALVTTSMAGGADPGRPAPLVGELFDRARRSTPDATAVIWGELTMTYAELGAAADRLAAHLHGLFPEKEPVGILLERSFDLVVAVLAVLRSGRPYVPLDPDYPSARLAHMIADSGLRVLLTSEPLAGTVPVGAEARVVYSEQWPGLPGDPVDVPIRAGDLAYIMYTSGSSGQPKGVAMPHGALANLVDWQCRNSACGRGARTLQFAALSFDVSFQEIFSTWSSGGALVLVDADVRMDGDLLWEVMRRHDVRRLFLPFVALQTFCHYAEALDLPALTALQEVITVGEALHVTPAVRRFFARIPGARLINQYGPTETHVVTALELRGDPSAWPDRPTIGRPIDRVSVHILNRSLQPQPIGVAGELCIAGDAVADGYFRAPELSRARFLRHHGERMYRTGDVAVLLPDGQIQLLGRQDDQVKVRGHRVELGEIEAVLRSARGVVDAAVVHSASAGGQLIAHYRAADDAPVDEQTLRRALTDCLPAYMVPQRFIPWHHALPRTPSGKVDRRTLAGMTHNASTAEKGTHR